MDKNGQYIISTCQKFFNSLERIYEMPKNTPAPATTPMDGTEWYACVATTILDDKAFKVILNGMLRVAGFTLLKDVDARYFPHGYSYARILSESHAVFATYPENGVNKVWVVSCIKEKLDRFIELVSKEERKGFAVVAEGIARALPEQELCRLGQPDVEELLLTYAPEKELA
jgi:hypothetical protein